MPVAIAVSASHLTTPAPWPPELFPQRNEERCHVLAVTIDLRESGAVALRGDAVWREGNPHLVGGLRRSAHDRAGRCVIHGDVGHGPTTHVVTTPQISAG